jgi:hypothetical protein
LSCLTVVAGLAPVRPAVLVRLLLQRRMVFASSCTSASRRGTIRLLG